MKRILTFSLVALLAIAAMAQQLRSPNIQIQNLEKGEQPVRISNLKIDVEIVGSLAVTTVDMTFFNPNKRVLEGELQFPLADGQSISRYALDINKRLREGVVVNKAQGQKAFESIVRRGVDPGLLEKTEGNNFRTRVYPLFANGTRRVVIAYEQELIPDGDKFRFVLPVQYQDVLDNFDLKITAFSDTQKPEIHESPWGKFSFNKAGEPYVASFSKKKYRTEGQIVVSIPVKKDINTFVEKGKISGQQVFYTQLFPEVKAIEKESPKKIAIFWDASTSRSKSSSRLETDLLKLYFSKYKNLTVELHTFNIKGIKNQSFDIKNGDWRNLESALSNVIYDGATQLGALDLSKIKADEIFLFSDGLSNLGNGAPPVLGKVPVNTINSTLSADYSMLKYISSKTGGVHINLLQQTAKEAVALLSTQTVRLLDIEYNKNVIDELTTSGVIVDPKKGLSIAGKMRGKEAQLSIILSVGNKQQEKYEVTLSANDTPSQYGNMVERLWAAKRIAELDMMYDQNREEIEDLGRTYNIVTRNTSLIVLEDVRDYVNFDITPPDELRDEYDRLKDSFRRRNKMTNDNHIDKVLNMFDRRKDWWNEIYPRRAPKKAEVSQPAPRPVQTPRPTTERVEPSTTRKTVKVSGTITDPKGEPIIGVSITVKDKPGRGVISDIDGKYTFQIEEYQYVQFSYIGFHTQEHLVRDRDVVIDAMMYESTETVLDEVTITGMGPQRKVTVTGAITTVDLTTLKTPPASISNALAGNVAGVMAMQQSGQPGENTSEFWIRGMSTFGGGANALVLVDGVESSLNDLDIEDIESFSVLKDASTTAIYGSKGANGVILITTKGNTNSSNKKDKPAKKKAVEPYIDQLKIKSDQELYKAYIQLKDKEEYAGLPAFYADVAALMEERGMKEDAFLVLSNLAEIKLQDYRVLRVLAHRLQKLGYNNYAIDIYKKVLELRPEEPQSYRDLALALANVGEYQEAIDMMYKVIEQPWDRRFGDIEVIALEEMNNMIYKAQRKGVDLILGQIDERLIYNMPNDIRIVLNWDTDNSDMDLWVTDPDGEKCYYKHKLTKIGGMISEDYTGGYGPEEFLLKKAIKGKYVIHADFYGTREQTLIGATTIYLDIYTHYGTPNEKKETISLRLSKDEGNVKVGEIVF